MNCAKWSISNLILIVVADVETHDGVAARKREIGITSATFLVFNRMIGTGIFATPSSILALTGSVGLSMMMWVFGLLIAAAGVAVYLEFGTAIPRNGGEKNYLEYVYRKPKFLATGFYTGYVLLLGKQVQNDRSHENGIDSIQDGLVRTR